MDKKLPLWRKIGYAIGDAGNNFCWTFIATFILIYCTDTLGLSAAVVGTLMMISKFLDGITDVLAGRIIDATRSKKMGKTRFWYLISIFPTALFTFLIFNIPGQLTENTKYIYFFIAYTLVSAVFYTMNSIAYGMLSIICAKRQEDRVQMGSYRFFFVIAASLIMNSFTIVLVEKFGGGQQGWRMVSLIYSTLCMLLLLIPFFSLKELPEEVEELNNSKKQEKISFMKSIKNLIHNKYFIMGLALYLIQYFVTGITGGMGIYFATYQIGNASFLGTMTVASALPMIFCLPLLPKMVGKIGVRAANLIGAIVSGIGAVIFIIGSMTVNIGVIILGLVIKGIGGTPLVGSLNALVGEIDEYTYLKNGYRSTGVLVSCSSVGVKVGTGIGTAVCGVILDVSGYNGLAATQTATAISAINWSYLLSNALAPIMLIVIFYFFRVEKDNKLLRERRK